MDEAVTRPIESGLGADSLRNRLIAALIMVCAASPLMVASLLQPAQGGMGTHMQMGLPDCGFKATTGLPCATCGCTTSFAHAANGSLLDAFITQPFGAVLALAAAMLTLIAGWAVYSGKSLAPLTQVLTTKRVVIPGLTLLLGAWIYKAAVVLMANPTG